MRGTEIAVEILILSLSKDEDFGPTSHMQFPCPSKGEQDSSFASPSMGKLSPQATDGVEPPPLQSGKANTHKVAPLGCGFWISGNMFPQLAV